MTRQEFETALDEGRLEIRMQNGNWWKVRRNGKTKLWKTRPKEFRTPIKYGFRGTGWVDHMNIQAAPVYLRIV